ncbi:MAG: hypothetical protein ACLQO1_07370 [Steroidobacteraceae bacterium]
MSNAKELTQEELDRLKAEVCNLNQRMELVSLVRARAAREIYDEIGRLSAQCKKNWMNSKQGNCPMPKGPKGQHRPADVIGAAVMVAKIATGELKESVGGGDDGKDRAALELGRRADG